MPSSSYYTQSFFISGRSFESIRVLRKNENVTKIQNWTIDEQRAYCAQRLGVAPIGAGAALSGIDRTLQTNISEMFFAKKIVLVEGIEDQAILESYLKKTDKYSNFLRAGGHIVQVGGKTKMPMIVALARGFLVDVFCMFDLDMDKDVNEQVNGQIITYAADVDDIISEQQTEDFSGSHFFGWLSNIQASIVADCAQWVSMKKTLAEEWGWNVSRMKKDPMLLAETISRLVDSEISIPALERVSSKLEEFWVR